MNKAIIIFPILWSLWGGALSAQTIVNGGRAIVGKWDASNAAFTLPVKAVLIANTPASCTPNKELLIKTDAASGQQLFICNTAGNGYVLLGGSAAGLADPGTNGIIKRSALNVTAPAVPGTDYQAPLGFTAENSANKGQSGGYAGLDGAAKVSIAQLPSIPYANLTGAPAALPPNGSASGDLSGSYPAPAVTKIQNRAVAATAPANGQYYAWNQANLDWEPAAPGSAPVSSVFGRTGIVAATAGDYAFNQISGTAGVSQGGTGIAAGIPGGLLYFTGATTIASSAAMTMNAVIKGAGAGTPLPTGVLIDSSNNIATPGTITTRDGSKVGDLALSGITSGSAHLSVPAVAGTGTFLLPVAGTVTDTLVSLAGTQTLTNKTLGPGVTHTEFYYVEFQGGECQNTTGVLGFSTPVSAGGTGVCITGTNTQLGASQFTALNQTVQGRMLLPDDWTSGINLDLRFTSSGSSGSVVFNWQYACIANTGASLNPALTTVLFTGVTAAANTSNQASLNNVSLSGCSAGNMLFFAIGLDNSSSPIGTIGNQNLLSARFKAKQIKVTQ
jgi:hypothetical protein